MSLYCPRFSWTPRNQFLKVFVLEWNQDAIVSISGQSQAECWGACLVPGHLKCETTYWFSQWVERKGRIRNKTKEHRKCGNLLEARSANQCQEAPESKSIEIPWSCYTQVKKLQKQGRSHWTRFFQSINSSKHSTLTGRVPKIWRDERRRSVLRTTYRAFCVALKPVSFELTVSQRAVCFP